MVEAVQADYRVSDMSRISISYRREDSIDITGRIFDRLTGRYGREAVFRDIDNIPLGTDFREHLKKVICENDVLIVVIGPDWTGEDQQGDSRILAEKDYVRAEVEVALAHDVPLIPLLVGNANMPEPGALPVSIRAFAYLNAFRVDSGRDFDHHVNGLIRATDNILRYTEENESKARTPGVDAKERSIFFPIVGGVMTAQGLMHTAWFIANLGSAYSYSEIERVLLDVWSYADFAFGIGGLIVGVSTICKKLWARFGGIILCVLASFSNSLWFVDNFDKSLSRLVLTGTGFATLLFFLGIHVYACKWPPDWKGQEGVY